MSLSDAWKDKRSDVITGLRQGALIGAIAAVVIVPAMAHLHAHRATHTPAALASVTGSAALADAPNGGHAPHVFRTADLAAHTATPDVRFVADWVADSHDNGPLPFVILDKRDARVYVFDAQARLIDSSPVLLGATPGDDSAAGIGQRPMSQVRQEEKTTPAGRFISAPGTNVSGEDVIWVDYDNAVSMHRVRPVDPKERRLERLASNDPRERRISYGCINVPVTFFESVVKPTVGSTRAVVYVLPEVKDVQRVFAGAYGPEDLERRASAAMAAPAS